MRDRFKTTSTNNAEPIYSYTEKDWVKCPSCGKKQFVAIERNKSKVEIHCRSCKQENVIEI